jgi:hypothetical protein
MPYGILYILGYRKPFVTVGFLTHMGYKKDYPLCMLFYGLLFSCNDPILFHNIIIDIIVMPYSAYNVESYRLLIYRLP